MMAKRVLFLLIAIVLCATTAFAKTILKEYDSLGDSEKQIFDTVVKEFRGEHYEFIGEISTTQKLILALAEPFNPLIAKAHEEEEGEDHEHDDDEKLNVKMVRASEDDGNINPAFIEEFGPIKLTYEKLYVVELSEKKITFEVSTDSSKKPGRKPGVPDPKIIARIASKLQGTVQANSIILP